MTKLSHEEFSRKGGKAQPVDFKRLGGKLRWHGLTKEQRADEMMKVRANKRKSNS